MQEWDFHIGNTNGIAERFEGRSSNSGSGVITGMRKDWSKGYGDKEKASGLSEKEILNLKYVFLATISPTGTI